MDQKCFYTTENDVTEIYDHKTILSIVPTNEDTTTFKITVSNKDKIFKTRHARIAPFVIAYGRDMISSIMQQ